MVDEGEDEDDGLRLKFLNPDTLENRRGMRGDEYDDDSAIDAGDVNGLASDREAPALATRRRLREETERRRDNMRKQWTGERECGEGDEVV